MRLIAIRACCAALLLALAALTAHAGEITDAGNIYDLTFGNVVDNGNGTENLVLTLTIDTSGFNKYGSNTPGLLVAVAPKIVTGNSSDYVGTPTLTTNAAGTWATMLGGESNGCSTGTPGFICSQNASGDLTGGAFTFQWAVTVNTLDLATGNDAASLKVWIPPTNGGTGNYQLSQNLTLTSTVPEPASMVLFSTILLLASFVLRRKLGIAR